MFHGIPLTLVGYQGFDSTREGVSPLVPIDGSSCSFPYPSPDSEDSMDWQCSTAQIIEFVVGKKVGLN